MKQVICNMDYPLVHTKAGTLRGYFVDDVFVFRGVKYADAKRFQMPQPVEPWEGVRDAQSYGYICCQQEENPPEHDWMNPHRYYPESEHCQYLNVWSRALDETAKKPVLFWIHGGGYTTGSGIEQYAYDGEALARHDDVVVVSINHRLNCLGFMDLSAYGEEYRYSGNAGLADIVAALRWVQENIAAFGGDPDNVTLFGQSGGGGKITCLMQSPFADGLYRKAIIQSGVLIREQPQADAQAFTAEVLEALGTTDHTVLETMSYAELNEVTQRVAKRHGKVGFGVWQPVVDGDFYKGVFTEVGFRTETANIPVMVGTTAGEFGVFAPEGDKSGWTAQEKLAMLTEQFGADAADVLAVFEKTYPGRDPMYLLSQDVTFRAPTLTYLKQRSATCEAPVYNYLFDYTVPVRGGKLAWHCAEIPFVFRNAEKELPLMTGGADIPKLTEILNGAWVSFAKTGDPNHPLLPAWEPYSAAHPGTMMLGLQPEMRSAFDEELMALLLAHPHLTV